MKMRKLVLCLLAMVGLSAFGAVSVPMIISHRGESSDAPENTMAAFRLAVERGVDAMECDVYVTADGVPVIMHDKSMRRTTGVNSNITDLPVSTVTNTAATAFGSWASSEYSEEKVPTLAQYLALLRDSEIKAVIELKEGNPNSDTFINAVAAAVVSEAAATPERVVFISFGADLVSKIRQVLPTYPALYLVSACPSDVNNLIATMAECHATGVDASSGFNADYVAAVRGAGYSFVTWTVDSTATAYNQTMMGVDGITTNTGKVLKDYITDKIDELNAEEAARMAVYAELIERNVPARGGWMRVDADSYADGMLINFDGIRNQGLNQPHNASAESWVNLGSLGTGINLSFTGAIIWEDDGFYFNQATRAVTAGNCALPAVFSMQYAMDIPDIATATQTTFPNYFSVVKSKLDNGVFTRNDNKQCLEMKLTEYGVSEKPRLFVYNWEGRYATFILDTATVYGTQTTNLDYSVSRSSAKATSYPWMFGSGSGGKTDGSGFADRYARGTYKSIRFYDHVLTTDEISWNRMIDEIRFRGVDDPIMVKVASSDPRFEGVEGNGDYLLTSAHTFSATNMVYNGDVFSPSGYVLETWNPSTESWVAADAVPDTSYTYTPGVSPSRVRLTWQWTGITRINGVYDLATEAAEVSGDVLVADGAKIVSSAFDEGQTGLTASGSFTVQGALTFDLNGFSGGTYTLVSAENVVLENGATVVLSNVGELTGIRRTLTCTDNSIVLTVERDGSLDEFVFNGDFAMNGTTVGNENTANAGTNWSYAYNPGFSIPWWKTSNTQCGLTVTNTPWLAIGQTNGGTYSYFVQSTECELSQNLGTVPAGIYRFSYNIAARPSHTQSLMDVTVGKNGTAMFEYRTEELTNTLFECYESVIVLTEAANYGLSFKHLVPSGDKAIILDDVSFRREETSGWSLSGGSAVIDGTGLGAAVPGRSFVDGDATIRSGSLLTFTPVYGTATLNVGGTLAVEGSVAVNIKGPDSLLCGEYSLIEAGQLTMANGAAFSLTSSVVFGENRAGVLELTDTGLKLRVYPTGNPIYKRNNTLSGNYIFWQPQGNHYWQTKSNWSSGAVPGFDANQRIIFTVADSVEINAYSKWTSGNAYLCFYNGTKTPVEFSASSGDFGLDTTSQGASGWAIVRGYGVGGYLRVNNGTYNVSYVYPNGNSDESEFSYARFELLGGSLTGTKSFLNCNFDLSRSDVLIDGCNVKFTNDYNSNINAFTKQVFRLVSGSLSVNNFQLGAGNYSMFDGEMSGGELTCAGNFSFNGANPDAAKFVLKGGRLITDTIMRSNSKAVFLIDGGTLSPYGNADGWLYSANFLTVTKGGTVLADTDGHNVRWMATVADDEGGYDFSLSKRGNGTLTFNADQLFTGTLAVDSGTLATVHSLSAGEITVASGASFSVANAAINTLTLPSITLAPGAVLEFDVNPDGCDVLAFTSIDITSASAEHPVYIDVSLSGMATLDDDTSYTLISRGVTDASKFELRGVAGSLSVRNGALIMTKSAATSNEWSGLANDGGKWSTGGNWRNGEPPVSGGSAVFNTSAGTTLFDITGLALSEMFFGEDAGAFVHTGDDSLTIYTSITNLSNYAQDIKMPVTLGVDGLGFSVYSAGDLIITNTITPALKTLVKDGGGTLLINDNAIACLSRLDINSGTVKLNGRTGTVLSANDEGGEIHIADGAGLDINHAPAASGIALASDEVTHGKVIYFEGNGPDGNGALYNSNNNTTWTGYFSHLVLTGDAKVGGGHMSLRTVANSALNDNVIEGPYALDIANQVDGLGFTQVAVNFDLKREDITGKTQLEGAQTGVIDEGVHVKNGGNVVLYGTTLPAGIPVTVDDNATGAFSLGSGTSYIQSAFTVGGDATAAFSANNTAYLTGSVTNNGLISYTGTGNIYFDCVPVVGGTYKNTAGSLWFTPAVDSPESRITVDSSSTLVFGANSGSGALPRFGAISATASKNVYFRPCASVALENDLFDDVVNKSRSSNGTVYIQHSNRGVWMTLNDRVWDMYSLSLGTSNMYANVRIGDGSSITVSGYRFTMGSVNPKPLPTRVEITDGGELNFTAATRTGVLIGFYEGVSGYRHELVVDGGSFNVPNTSVYVGYCSQYAYLTLNAGLVSAKGVNARCNIGENGGANGTFSTVAHDERFSQYGGTLELGGSGFGTTHDKQGMPHLDLSNGVLRATADFSNTYGMLTAAFGESPAGGGKYTVDLNGHAVNWNNALLGAADVSITGAGSFSTDPKLQGIPTGKWAVENSAANVDLSGAAGFAGGLELGEDVKAQIDIGTTNLVEYALFTSKTFATLDDALACSNSYPLVASSFKQLHTYMSAGTIGKVYFCYRGQFYVPENKAGTWYFGGTYDNQLVFDIDGVNLIKTTTYKEIATASVQLAAGWHDFRVIAWDDGGGQGAHPDAGNSWSGNMALGYSTDAWSEDNDLATVYARFDTDTLAMRISPESASRTGVRMRLKGESSIDTYALPTETYVSYDNETNSLDAVHLFNTFDLSKSNNVRFDGWFKVPEENAGVWNFTGQYDDRICLEIDGVVVLATTAYNASKSGSATLDAGWHRFVISVYDGSGSWGGKLKDDNNLVCALKVKAANAEKTLAFNGDNFRIVFSAVDTQKDHLAGLDGVVTLAEGSKLTNNALGACPILGTLTGTGALVGRFAFVGSNSCWRVQGSGGRLDVADYAGVTNTDFVKQLANVDVEFPDGDAAMARYTLCSAGDLTAPEAEAIKVTATGKDGEELPGWSAALAGDKLVLINPHPQGTLFMLH
ncbi:MAG: hypothetical protein IJU44_13415 [Kiritimatiellae bacterium]|nr:hypothetical protein [Kiritimatiellia bacterium]